MAASCRAATIVLYLSNHIFGSFEAVKSVSPFRGLCVGVWVLRWLSQCVGVVVVGGQFWVPLGPQETLNKRSWGRCVCSPADVTSGGRLLRRWHFTSSGGTFLSSQALLTADRSKVSAAARTVAQPHGHGQRGHRRFSTGGFFKALFVSVLFHTLFHSERFLGQR